MSEKFVKRQAAPEEGERCLTATFRKGFLNRTKLQVSVPVKDALILVVDNAANTLAGLIQDGRGQTVVVHSFGEALERAQKAIARELANTEVAKVYGIPESDIDTEFAKSSKAAKQAPFWLSGAGLSGLAAIGTAIVTGYSTLHNRSNTFIYEIVTISLSLIFAGLVAIGLEKLELGFRERNARKTESEFLRQLSEVIQERVEELRAAIKGAE